MWSWVPALLKGVWDLGGKWMQNKAEKADALHQLELKVLTQDGDWNNTMAQVSQGSWKDEWFVFIFSIPLVSIMLSPILEVFLVDTPYVQGDLTAAALLGLQGLDSAPDWYVVVVLVMVSASFGYKKLADFAVKRLSK